MTTITIIDVYHGVNRFLGTTSGELTKYAFELVLFTLVTYMVASEWTRSRDQKKESLQWLLWGFAILSATKLIATAALSFTVFGGLPSPRFFAQVSIFDQTFEILAFLMIAIAFLQPVLSRRLPHLMPRRRTLLILAVMIGLGLFAILIKSIGSEPMIIGLYRPAFTWFNMVKILICWASIAYIWKNRDEFLSVSRYYPNVTQAIAVYSLAPLVHIINYLAYNNQMGELIVLSQPIPFLAVLLFTRVIFLQMSDKAALYDELASAQAKYQKEKELCDLKDDFVSTVSHELKTPLTSISLWGSLMGSGKLGRVSAKQKEACSIIKTESFRLAHLINDVLDLSKMEKGKIAIRLETADLKAACGLESFKAMAAEKRIELLNEVPDGMTAEIDTDRFKQVIYNLASNAIKFTEPGGRVFVSAARRGSETVVTVTDTGIGIPSDKLEGLFTKFYQVENHLTRKSGGTGLGLAISKQIVELHGGTISVESEIGRGTTFTIRLPGRIGT